jgi:hypothetical protein
VGAAGVAVAGVVDAAMTIRYPDTLGPYVADWIEGSVRHGPGDLLGRPMKLTREMRRFLDKAYRLDPGTGRRIVKVATYSRRKGTAKSELAGGVGIAETVGPVRCVLDGNRVVARPPVDPWVVCAATTEHQAEETVYGAIKEMIKNSPDLKGRFDPGEKETRLVGRSGVITRPAMNPGALDGQKPTCQLQEEPHRWLGPKLHECDTTLANNLAKRALADPWTMLVTTAHQPGQGSVGEAHFEHGLLVNADPEFDPSAVYDHLEASPHHKLETDEGLRAAIAEAAGDAYWYDLEDLVRKYRKLPEGRRSNFERYWLNRSVAAEDAFTSASQWARMRLRKDGRTPRPFRPGDAIVCGFDGSQSSDATVLVGVRLSDGHAQLLACWAPPEDADALTLSTWRVNRNAVDFVVRQTFARYRVVRFEGDPPFFEDKLEEWRRDFGADRVRAFLTQSPKAMGAAIDRAETMLEAASFTHDASPVFAAHMVAARVDKDRGYKRLRKPPASLEGGIRRIDAAVAWVIANDARGRVMGKGLDLDGVTTAPEPAAFAQW